MPISGFGSPEGLFFLIVLMSISGFGCTMVMISQKDAFGHVHFFFLSFAEEFMSSR